MTTKGQGYAIAQAFDMRVSTHWYHGGYRFDLNGIDSTLEISDGIEADSPVCFEVFSAECDGQRLCIATDGFYVVIPLEKEGSE